MKRNISLIGAGQWGKNHLKNLEKLGVLVSVLDPNVENTLKITHEFSGVQIARDEREILDNPEIEAVVIAAPAALHFDLSMKFLHAGKDVLVEKPLSLTVAEGSQLVQTASETNRILMVGHILQYHAAVIKLKELVDAGELGEIRYIYSNRLNIGKLRAEENVLWSFAPHDISLILMLLNGEEPVHVDAFGGAYVKPGIYDTTLTMLEFRNGVKGHIFVDWLHPFKEQKLVVVGSKKMAVFDDGAEEKQKLLIYPHKIDFIDGVIPVAHKADSYPVAFEMKEPLKEELLHFIRCVETRQKPKTDGVEGLNVLKILEKAEKAMKNRK
ncbi:MAG: Gfo/Idh/MocA family protein [Candidatus Omnitrophota bacterium]